MFEDMIGQYSYPANIQHDIDAGKSYIFVSDHWQEAGEIKFNVRCKGQNRATMEFLLPRLDLFADQHTDEGIDNWLVWGPRVN